MKKYLTAETYKGLGYKIEFLEGAKLYYAKPFHTP